MLFKFNRKKHDGWSQVEMKANDKTYLADGFHIYDKDDKTIAIVHKDPKSKHIEIILDEGAYIKSMWSFDKINK